MFFLSRSLVLSIDSHNLNSITRHCGPESIRFSGSSRRSFVSGISLLNRSRRILAVATDPKPTQTGPPNSTTRVQRLKKKFHFHFQDYVDLIFWKVQFLDRHHLLIKFGSVDGGVEGR
ncbi:unnamed protein product [Microthlaspi erraticum]|uniref:Uncharacterized protein n=1 Tax=Microthlaspi erraticum TaxID=1685480 RepID=A0A6D2KAR7_9BRAS|nr:unnamed protein product [Microthlaspi erraticum]